MSDNELSWTREEITIHLSKWDTDYGKVRIPGYTYGPLAVHRCYSHYAESRQGGYWNITHLPTGFSVLREFRTMRFAKLATERLIALAEDSQDWYKGKFGTEDGFGAARKRLTPTVRQVNEERADPEGQWES